MTGEPLTVLGATLTLCTQLSEPQVPATLRETILGILLRFTCLLKPRNTPYIYGMFRPLTVSVRECRLSRRLSMSVRFPLVSLESPALLTFYRYRRTIYMVVGLRLSTPCRMAWQTLMTLKLLGITLFLRNGLIVQQPDIPLNMPLRVPQNALLIPRKQLLPLVVPLVLARHAPTTHGWLKLDYALDDVVIDAGPPLRKLVGIRLLKFRTIGATLHVRTWLRTSWLSLMCRLNYVVGRGFLIEHRPRTQNYVQHFGLDRHLCILLLSQLHRASALCSILLRLMTLSTRPMLPTVV